MAEPEILKPKIEASGILEVFGIGVAKIIEERMTSPYIGNGTLQSGLIKGVLGGIAHSYIPKGYINTIISGAFLVDAGEDAAVALMGGFSAPAATDSGAGSW